MGIVYNIYIRLSKGKTQELKVNFQMYGKRLGTPITAKQQRSDKDESNVESKI